MSAHIVIPVGAVKLEGELRLAAEGRGVAVFVHGSGSSRHSPRNQAVATALREAGIGTLLFDLLTRQEEVKDDITGSLRFDISLLAGRLLAVTRWLRKREPGMLIGYFGASTGAAAALAAAAKMGGEISAVVSRGGRPDLAGAALGKVTAPTLLLVGGLDEPVIDLNLRALEQLRCEKDLRIVPGATHLFEQPGAIEQVAHLAARWFGKHFHQPNKKEASHEFADDGIQRPPAGGTPARGSAE